MRYVCYVGTVSIVLQWNEFFLWCDVDSGCVAAVVCCGRLLVCDVCVRVCHSGVEDSVFWDDKRCRFVRSHLITCRHSINISEDMNRRRFDKLRVSDHPRYSLCSRAAMFLLWDGEYFYLHICSVVKTSGSYLLTELTSVMLRLELISGPRIPH